MGLDIDYTDGQTPLDEDEREGLLIPSITTRFELDELEQQNIEQAIQWTMKRNFKKEEILTEAFLKAVHKRMYGRCGNGQVNLERPIKTLEWINGR